MQKTNETKIVKVDLGNGAGAIVPMLVADLNSDRKLALVDQGVLKHLVGLLEKTDLNQIKTKFIAAVTRAETMQEYTDVLSEELAFHMSVNMIQTYYSIDAEAVESPKKASTVTY